MYKYQDGSELFADLREEGEEGEEGEEQGDEGGDSKCRLNQRLVHGQTKELRRKFTLLNSDIVMAHSKQQPLIVERPTMLRPASDVPIPSMTQEMDASYSEAESPISWEGKQLASSSKRDQKKLWAEEDRRGKPLTVEDKKQILRMLDVADSQKNDLNLSSSSHPRLTQKKISELTGKHQNTITKIKKERDRQKCERVTDSDGKVRTIEVPLSGKQGGYRWCRLTEDQKRMCTRIAIENPRLTCSQIRQRVQDQNPGLHVCDSTIWRVLSTSNLQYLRAKMHDPKSEGTTAHAEEKVAFFAEQQKGQAGMLGAHDLFFMDETSVPLNLTSTRAWGTRNRPAIINHAKGITKNLGLYAGIGMVSSTLDDASWQNSHISPPESADTPRSNAYSFRDNSWVKADTAPQFMLYWWIRPPVRKQLVLSRFLTPNDILALKTFFFFDPTNLEEEFILFDDDLIPQSDRIDAFLKTEFSGDEPIDRLAKLLWKNGVEWREVDSDGDLVSSRSGKGRSIRPSASSETMKDRFRALQDLVRRAREVRSTGADVVGDGDGSNVPRFYYTSTGRRTLGGTIESERGDRGLFLRYLTRHSDYVKETFPPSVHENLVDAWDSATEHGKTDVTRNTKSFIHEWVETKLNIRGAIFLPVRDPDLNPVELLFSFIKSVIRRKFPPEVGEVEVEEMVKMIDEAFSEVTLDMLKGWLRYGCYHIPGESTTALRNNRRCRIDAVHDISSYLSQLLDQWEEDSGEKIPHIIRTSAEERRGIDYDDPTTHAFFCRFNRVADAFDYVFTLSDPSSAVKRVTHGTEEMEAAPGRRQFGEDLKYVLEPTDESASQTHGVFKIGNERVYGKNKKYTMLHVRNKGLGFFRYDHVKRSVKISEDGMKVTLLDALDTMKTMKTTTLSSHATPDGEYLVHEVEGEFAGSIVRLSQLSQLSQPDRIIVLTNPFLTPGAEMNQKIGLFEQIRIDGGYKDGKPGPFLSLSTNMKDETRIQLKDILSLADDKTGFSVFRKWMAEVDSSLPTNSVLRRIEDMRRGKEGQMAFLRQAQDASTDVLNILGKYLEDVGTHRKADILLDLHERVCTKSMDKPGETMTVSRNCEMGVFYLTRTATASTQRVTLVEGKYRVMGTALGNPLEEDEEVEMKVKLFNDYEILLVEAGDDRLKASNPRLVQSIPFKGDDLVKVRQKASEIKDALAKTAFSSDVRANNLEGGERDGEDDLVRSVSLSVIAIVAHTLESERMESELSAGMGKIIEMGNRRIDAACIHDMRMAMEGVLRRWNRLASGQEGEKGVSTSGEVAIGKGRRLDADDSVPAIMISEMRSKRRADLRRRAAANGSEGERRWPGYPLEEKEGRNGSALLTQGQGEKVGIDDVRIVKHIDIIKVDGGEIEAKLIFQDGKISVLGSKSDEKEWKDLFSHFSKQNFAELQLAKERFKNTENKTDNFPTSSQDVGTFNGMVFTFQNTRINPQNPYVLFDPLDSKFYPGYEFNIEELSKKDRVSVGLMDWNLLRRRNPSDGMKNGVASRYSQIYGRSIRSNGIKIQTHKITDLFLGCKIYKMISSSVFYFMKSSQTSRSLPPSVHSHTKVTFNDPNGTGIPLLIVPREQGLVYILHDVSTAPQIVYLIPKFLLLEKCKITSMETADLNCNNQGADERKREYLMTIPSRIFHVDASNVFRFV